MTAELFQICNDDPLKNMLHLSETEIVPRVLAIDRIGKNGVGDLTNLLHTSGRKME